MKENRHHGRGSGVRSTNQRTRASRRVVAFFPSPLVEKVRGLVRAGWWVLPIRGDIPPHPSSEFATLIRATLSKGREEEKPGNDTTATNRSSFDRIPIHQE